MEMKNERGYLFCLKAAAIFCVVCAHVATVPVTAGKVDRIFSSILDCLGTMGVPVFYMVSGYFYGKNQELWGKFWKKKIKKLVLPWIFCFTLVWLYVVVRKGGVSFFNWFKFILGIGSIAYYLTVLLFFFLTLWRARCSNIIMILGIVVSAIGLILTANNHPLMGLVNTFTINSYMNPIHWLGYFCAGVIISHFTTMQELGKRCSRIVWLTGILLVLSVALHIHFDIAYTYFSRYAIINMILSTVFLMGVMYLLEGGGLSPLLQKIGKASFSIYLLHQLFAGGVVWITSKLDMHFIILLRPFITIAFVILGLECLCYINERAKGRFGLLYTLIGIREL